MLLGRHQSTHERRSFRRGSSWLFVGFWSLWIGCAGAPADTTAAPEAVRVTSKAQAAITRPNIVFILTDDLNQEVYDHTPGLKNLLNPQGTEFKNHFVTISLCCPSRVATLRGQFAHNSGIFSNGGEHGGFEKVYTDGLESETAAVWLQNAGYRTALIGKYLNGYPGAAPSETYIPAGWTRWFSPNGGNPYTEYNYDLNENGTTVHYAGTPEDYGVDVVSNKAATFIRNTTSNFPNKPFFLYVAPYVPHGPATPPPRYQDNYPDAKAPRGPAFNEADVSDKPAWLRNKPLLTAQQINAIDTLYRKRLQTMLAVEDLVKNVIDTLSATGQLDNTYIFFTSDNGFHQGQHRLASGKNTAFDTDLAVPLIVRGPGVPAGGVVNSITANVDYASTFLELAGVPAPNLCDGRSLAPFLRGQTPSVWRKALLLEHNGPSLTEASSDGTLEPQDDFDVQAQTSAGAPVFLGLRTAQRTYVQYDTGEHELYDLSADPHQLSNIYGSASAAEKARFTQWVANLRDAAGNELRNAEEVSP
jgi:arylsulfatase A-like enzyme